MTLNDFISKLVEVENKGTTISLLLNCALDEFSGEVDLNDVEKQLNNIDEKEFTNFGDKMARCLRLCKELKEGAEEYQADPYSIKVKQFYGTLDEISKLVVKISSNRKKGQVNTSAAISQNDDVLAEQNLRIKSLRDDITKATATIDEKIFSLLINTVAILGIFVAIAFAGFGTVSIFSSVDISAALSSPEAFIKHTYFLMLIGFLCYNLLLVLIYFIFKLSRPLLKKAKSEDECKNLVFVGQEDTFSHFINLVPFYVIDGLIALVVVVLFVWCTFLL